MTEKIMVRESLAIGNIVYGPAMEIPLAEWLRLPVKERNMLLNKGRVEQREE